MLARATGRNLNDARTRERKALPKRLAIVISAMATHRDDLFSADQGCQSHPYSDGSWHADGVVILKQFTELRFNPSGWDVHVGDRISIPNVMVQRWRDVRRS